MARFTILAVAYLAGIGINVALFHWGVLSPALRWPIAFVAGYAAFLLTVKAWLLLNEPPRRATSRRQFAGHDVTNAFDWPFAGSPSGGTAPAAGGFAGRGGNFGGGGASGAFGGDAAAGPATSGPGLSLPDIDVDVPDGDGLPVFVIIVLTLAVIAVAAAVIGSAVWLFMAMPHLLHEAAAAAALTGLAARRRDGWMLTVLKHSWAPAAITGLFLATAGAALSHFLPAAHTLGQALRLLGAAW